MREASRLTSVPFDTLVTATRTQRLAIYRDPGIYRDSVAVHIVDLILFMLRHAPEDRRWKPENVPVSEIQQHPDYQPRLGSNRKLIEELATHIRRGGAIEPVWLIANEQGHLLLVDGHRRLAASKACQRTEITAVVLPVPPIYGVAIARAVNQRNGERLSDSSTRKIVETYLIQHPEVLSQITEGAVRQAAVARELDISEAALSRAIKHLGGSRKQPPELPVRQLVKQLGKVIGNLRHEDPDDSPEVAMILYRATKAIFDGWSIAQKKDIDARLRLATSAVSRSITPEIRALLFRRGGDRRRGQQEGGGACKS